jgi:hypothetical protein
MPGLDVELLHSRNHKVQMHQSMMQKNAETIKQFLITMADTSKQHEGELSPKNPSLQLILSTAIGVVVLVLLAASAYYGLIRF